MESGELTISASEFKAKCLDLFDQLAARKLKRIVVLKRGRPVAVVNPPPSGRDAADALFGCMRGTVVTPKGVDVTRPVLDEPLHALKGRIHE
jgi:hypothetical protein